MRVTAIGAVQLFLTTLLLLISPLEAAPTHDGAGSVRSGSSFQEDHNEEQQLRDLKAIPDNMAVQQSQMKSFSNINGKVEVHETKEEKLTDATSGKVFAKVTKDIGRSMESEHVPPKTVTKTEIDIPSEGIHQISVNKKGNKATPRGDDMKRRPNSQSSETSEDYYTPYDGGVQYTPTDMAEYIRRTGDDQGVALAVEELMREGLMPRNEAAAYLEEVKSVLEYMQQDDYANSQMRNPYKSNQQQQQQQSAPLRNNGNDHGERRLSLMPPGGSQFSPSSRKPSLGSNSPSTTTPGSRSTSIGGKGALNSMSRSQHSRPNPTSTDSSEEMDEMPSSPRSHNNERHSDDVEYLDLLERLRIADFLYKEYSLEEVIYQLAKEMFTQSIIKGNRDAEESLERFSTFLQEETADGRISKELETKILDVVMAALMDAVGARPLEADQGSGEITRESTKETNRRPEMTKPAYNGKGINYDPKNPKTEMDSKNALTKEQLTYDKSMQRKMIKSGSEKGPSASKV